MLVRFITSVQPAPNVLYEARRQYDLDPKVANAFIAQGVAAAVNVTALDKSGTPGNTTIDNSIGRAAIAAGATSCVITNAFCKASSVVQVQLETADATLQRTTVTPANGSFTVTGNAAATGITKFNFSVDNF